MRVSPNDIVTDSLDHALAMSSVRSPYRRSEIYSNVKFDFEVDHVFSERDENRHQSLRKKLSAGVSLLLVVLSFAIAHMLIYA